MATEDPSEDSPLNPPPSLDCGDAAMDILYANTLPTDHPLTRKICEDERMCKDFYRYQFRFLNRCDNNFQDVKALLEASQSTQSSVESASVMSTINRRKELLQEGMSKIATIWKFYLRCFRKAMQDDPADEEAIKLAKSKSSPAYLEQITRTSKMIDDIVGTTQDQLSGDTISNLSPEEILIHMKLQCMNDLGENLHQKIYQEIRTMKSFKVRQHNSAPSMVSIIGDIKRGWFTGSTREKFPNHVNLNALRSQHRLTRIGSVDREKIFEHYSHGKKIINLIKEISFSYVSNENSSEQTNCERLAREYLGGGSSIPGLAFNSDKISLPGFTIKVHSQNADDGLEPRCKTCLYLWNVLPCGFSEFTKWTDRDWNHKSKEDMIEQREMKWACAEHVAVPKMCRGEGKIELP